MGAGALIQQGLAAEKLKLGVLVGSLLLQTLSFARYVFESKEKYSGKHL